MSFLLAAAKEARLMSLRRRRLDSVKILVQDACKNSLGTIYPSAILYFKERGNAAAVEQILVWFYYSQWKYVFKFCKWKYKEAIMDTNKTPTLLQCVASQYKWIYKQKI